MGKILVLILSLLLIPQWVLAEESDQLEQAYKDQYLRYTEEIETLQKSIEVHQKTLDRQEALLNEARNTPGITRSDMKSFYNDALRTASYKDKDRKRLKELEEKKQDLKIKVLEHKKTLPSWWVK